MTVLRMTGMAAVAVLALDAPLSAAPISIDAQGDAWEVFNFLVTDGTRSWGSSGTFIAFGLINVTPNGYAGTTGTATQNGLTLPLNFDPSTTNPNQFDGGMPYDPAYTGSWQITLMNGPDTLVVDTPAIGNAQPVPPVTGMTLSGPATTPTLSWSNPNNVQEVHINIFDLQARLGTSNAPNRIYSNRLGSGVSTFTIPAGVLSPNHLYSVGIETGVIRGSGTNPSGSSQATAYLSSTYTFFDFSTGALPNVPGVYLPVTSVSSGTPIFNFNNPVLANQISYYDPAVAIGYDYAIGAGDPLFRSVLLPNIGDGLFDLYLPSAAGYTFLASVLAGTEYFFAQGGVSAFRVLGIETTAGLDPFDPNAFVTGLSFVSDGQFTGTMIPIAADPAAVPLPAGLLLLAPVLAGMALVRRRRTA